MAFLRGLFKSLVSSFIITALFCLIGLSLFVGDFPPTISQVKNVFVEYKNMLRLKEKILDENKFAPDDQLIEALERGPQEQFRKIAQVRNANAAAAEQVLKEDQEISNMPVAVAVETPVKLQPADIPKEWQEQFYRLRAEVFRLNQRVAELEKQKTMIRPPSSPQK